MSALVGENPQGSEVILYLGIFTLQFSDLHVEPVVLLSHELHDHLGANRLAVVEAVESHLVGPRHLSPGPDIAHINIERLCVNFPFMFTSGLEILLKSEKDISR